MKYLKFQQLQYAIFVIDAVLRLLMAKPLLAKLTPFLSLPKSQVYHSNYMLRDSSRNPVTLTPISLSLRLQTIDSWLAIDFLRLLLEDNPRAASCLGSEHAQCSIIMIFLAGGSFAIGMSELIIIIFIIK